MGFRDGFRRFFNSDENQSLREEREDFDEEPADHNAVFALARSEEETVNMLRSTDNFITLESSFIPDSQKAEFRERMIALKNEISSRRAELDTNPNLVGNQSNELLRDFIRSRWRDSGIAEMVHEAAANRVQSWGRPRIDQFIAKERAKNPHPDRYNLCDPARLERFCAGLGMEVPPVGERAEETEGPAYSPETDRPEESGRPPEEDRRVPPPGPGRSPEPHAPEHLSEPASAQAGKLDLGVADPGKYKLSDEERARLAKEQREFSFWGIVEKFAGAKSPEEAFQSLLINALLYLPAQAVYMLERRVAAAKERNKKLEAKIKEYDDMMAASKGLDAHGRLLSEHKYMIEYYKDIKALERGEPEKATKLCTEHPELLAGIMDRDESGNFTGSLTGKGKEELRKRMMNKGYRETYEHAPTPSELKKLVQGSKWLESAGYYEKWAAEKDAHSSSGSERDASGRDTSVPPGPETTIPPVGENNEDDLGEYGNFERALCEAVPRIRADHPELFEGLGLQFKEDGSIEGEVTEAQREEIGRRLNNIDLTEYGLPRDNLPDPETAGFAARYKAAIEGNPANSVVNSASPSEEVTAPQVPVPGVPRTPTEPSAPQSVTPQTGRVTEGPPMSPRDVAADLSARWNRVNTAVGDFLNATAATYGQVRQTNDNRRALDAARGAFSRGTNSPQGRVPVEGQLVAGLGI